MQHVDICYHSPSYLAVYRRRVVTFVPDDVDPRATMRMRGLSQYILLLGSSIPQCKLFPKKKYRNANFVPVVYYIRVRKLDLFSL